MRGRVRANLGKVREIKRTASMKMKKPLGTQLFGSTKEMAAKAVNPSTKGSSMGGARKGSQKPQEPKKKGKGGKSGGKN